MSCHGLKRPHLVLVLSMIPQLQFNNWQWLSFALVGPVFFYGGKPFHVAALQNLRHGAFTMDTLISLGTSAAFFWSVWALFFGNAGMNNMRMSMSLSAHSHEGMDQIYLESVGMVIVFLLLGRWFETRAKGRSSEALRALLDMGAKDVSVLVDGATHRIPICLSSSLARRSPPMVWWLRAIRRWTSPCSRANRCQWR